MVLIGVGNEYRQDDGVGIFIVRWLKRLNLQGVAFKESQAEGTDLLQACEKKDFVILFDAVCSGTKAGTIFRFDATKEVIPQKLFNFSTHVFSVVQTIELAKALNRLPDRLVVYGIEGNAFGHGQGLSLEVSKAAGEVMASVKKEIRDYQEVFIEER